MIDQSVEKASAAPIADAPGKGFQLLLKVFPRRGFVGEIDSCLGIDLQAPSGAPGGKRIGIDIHFDEGAALTPQTIRDALRSVEPIVVACGQALAICE